jgi:hypothetical protein
MGRKWVSAYPKNLDHHSGVHQSKEDTVKSRKSILIAVLVSLTALALPVQLDAQHTRYKLID